MLKFIGCMMQLIISPGKGWADIDEVGESPQQLATSGFYPLLGITACSAFLPRIYDKNLHAPGAGRKRGCDIRELFHSLFSCIRPYVGHDRQGVDRQSR